MARKEFKSMDNIVIKKRLRNKDQFDDSNLKGRPRVMSPNKMGRTRQPWMKRPKRTVKK